MQNMQRENISNWFISQLTDWEILSAYKYCNMILDKESVHAQIEFDDMCFFLFDGNKKITSLAIEEAKKIYCEEYSKRHIN